MQSTRSLIFLMICIINISCAQSDDNSRSIADGYMLKIKTNDFNGLYQSFATSRKSLVDSTGFRVLVEKYFSIINTASYVDTNDIHMNSNTLVNSEGVQIIKTYTYPCIFRRHEMNDSTINILISITNQNLYNIRISDHRPGSIFLDPPKTPHRDSFNFKVSELSWFRLWYESGTVRNEFGDEFGYYAVDGNNQKSIKCGLHDHFEEMLLILNKVEFDSMDFKVMNSNTTGKSEHIYLRMKFENSEYSSLDEFRIIYCLAEEPGVREEYFDYILLLHSESTRYFIKKDKYPELKNVLSSIARKDYGNCIERRFH